MSACGPEDLLLLLLLALTFSSDLQQEEVDVSLEVITNSSPCSATCGLGLRTQTLCRMKDGLKAVEEEDVRGAGGGGGGGGQVSDRCRVHTLQCVQSWRCGLQTLTVTSGERVEMDCLGDVMKTVGRFSWRVSWRRARGIVTSDDSLFAHWKATDLDRVILEPVREDDAGTYRCEVQDASYRRVKRVYWGIRVLPLGFVCLDLESSLSQWDQTGNQSESGPCSHDLVMMGVSVAAVLLSVILGLCFVLVRMKVGRRREEIGSQK